MDRVRAFKSESASTGGGQEDGSDWSATNPNQDYLDSRGYIAQNDTSNDTNVGWSRDASNNFSMFDSVSGTKTLAQVLAAAPGAALGAPTSGNWSTGQASLANTTKIVDAIQAVNVAVKAATTAANGAAQQALGNPTSGDYTATPATGYANIYNTTTVADAVQIINGAMQQIYLSAGTALTAANSAQTSANNAAQKALGNPTSGTTYPGTATISTSTHINDAVQALNAAIASVASTVGSPGQQAIGAPTTGDYSAGQASVSNTSKIADAIQAINYSLKTAQNSANTASATASAPGQQAEGAPSSGDWSTGQASLGNTTKIVDALQAINVALKTTTTTANAANTAAAAPAQKALGSPTSGTYPGSATISSTTLIADAVQALNAAIPATSAAAPQQTLGSPTSGDYSTGQASLATTTKIVDAIQAVNVALKTTTTTANSASTAASAAQTTANSPGQQTLGNPTAGDYTGYASFSATSKIVDAFQAINSGMASISSTANGALTAANNYSLTNTPNKLVKRASDGSVAVSTPVQIFASSGNTHTTTTDEAGTLFQLQGGVTAYSLTLTLGVVPSGQNIMFMLQHVAIAGATLSVKSGAGNIFFNGGVTNGTISTTSPQSTMVVVGLAGSSNYIVISMQGVWADSYTGKTLACGFTTDLSTYIGQATAANTNSTLMMRDANGQVAATTFTGALAGNASTATTAGSATNFTGSLAGDVTGTQGATSVAKIGTTQASAIQAATALVAGTGKAANTFVASDGASNTQRLIVSADLPLVAPAKVDPNGSTAGQAVVSTGGTGNAAAWGYPTPAWPLVVSVTSTTAINPALADNGSIYYCNVTAAGGAAINLPAADSANTYVFEFLVCTTQGVTVNVPSGAQLLFYGTSGTVAGNVKSIVVGTWFTLQRNKGGSPNWFLTTYFSPQNNALSFS